MRGGLFTIFDCLLGFVVYCLFVRLMFSPA